MQFYMYINTESGKVPTYVPALAEYCKDEDFIGNILYPATRYQYARVQAHNCVWGWHLIVITVFVPHSVIGHSYSELQH